MKRSLFLMVVIFLEFFRKVGEIWAKILRTSNYLPAPTLLPATSALVESLIIVTRSNRVIASYVGSEPFPDSFQ